MSRTVAFLWDKKGILIAPSMSLRPMASQQVRKLPPRLCAPDKLDGNAPSLPMAPNKIFTERPTRGLATTNHAVHSWSASLSLSSNHTHTHSLPTQCNILMASIPAPVADRCLSVATPRRGLRYVAFAYGEASPATGVCLQRDLPARSRRAGAAVESARHTVSTDVTPQGGSGRLAWLVWPRPAILLITTRC